MNKKMISRMLSIAFGIALLGMVIAPIASAQCGYSSGSKMIQPKLQPQSWQEPARRMPVPLTLVSEVEPPGAAIVGFWKVLMVAEGNDGIPDGTVIDFGFAQWHSDGTEILNSGTRPPATGNFCLGVWKKTGGSAYKLNHFGLSWDGNGNFI